MTIETVRALTESDRSVLRRLLDILDAFSVGGPYQTVSGICRQTALPPATVHRMLAALIEAGAVDRLMRGRYQLGLRMWRIGSSVPQARLLRDVAMPYLEDLYEATHEVVHLAVLDGGTAMYVEKISGRGAVPVASGVGKRLPLHATGPGKVLLAFSPPQVLDQVLATGLRKVTRNTIDDEAVLRRALAEIRRSGVAVSREEMTVGTSSVAAPVFARDGAVAASVSVVVPSMRLNAPALIPLVSTVGRAISRRLVG